MALGPGNHIGPYEITALLGEGGMGKVWRAHHTGLKRDDALKVLPDAFASDPERLARFQREAQVLASLNHPNIAHVHGLERSDGVQALVMELVDGPTLADRIAQGPIPVDEALAIARQIAEALEAAHEQGIIHRDLKPANIKVRPDGTVKVLDFGLAKALEPMAARVDATASPTITSPAMMTGVGMLLGTAAYMSPEQARGKAVDKRGDIWAFGCVLYEMLTGRRAFEGEDVSVTLADVIRAEPAWNQLPEGLSPSLATYLRRCLRKDPRDRVRDIGDVRLALDGAFDAPTDATQAHAPVARPMPLWRRAVMPAATALVAAAIVGAVAWSVRPAPGASIMRFSIVLPADQLLTRTGRHNIAVSPDGQNVVYVANARLYLRAMGDVEARAILGTDQDINTPFFSPDGRWIGFHVVPEGKLKKVALTGGASVTIADVANPYGASWELDDRVLVGQGGNGIVRVSANGGTPETIVKVEPNEFAHGPQMLPDGDHVLFTVAKGTNSTRWDQAQIVIQSLQSGERRVLVNGGSDARYVPSGHIVYALGANLLAVPFDARSVTVTGGPVPILEGIGRSLSAQTAAMFYSFSASGALAYFVSSGVVQNNRSLALVARKGESTTLQMPPLAYTHPRISPDGRQLAVVILAENGSDIWVYDLAGALAPRRLTFAGANFSPSWTPDGRRIAFVSSRDDNRNAIFWQAADGSGSAERLTDPKTVQPTDLRFSADGNIVYRDGITNSNIWILPLDGDRKPRLVIDSPGPQYDASLSPDGRWMAYGSAESGSPRIYVQPYPPTGAKYQVTTTLSFGPMWSPDGRQIFYLEDQPNTLDDRLMSVDVRADSGFTYANPTPLVDKILTNGGAWPFDVSRDGGQFLVFVRPDNAASETAFRPEIRVTLNWFDELRRRAPTN